MNENGFNIEFTHNGINYLAFVHHIEELSPEQRERYNIRENSFFVHLFTGAGFNSFELYSSIDPLIWETNASPFVVDPEIVSIIGDRIDSLSM